MPPRMHFPNVDDGIDLLPLPSKKAKTLPSYADLKDPENMLHVVIFLMFFQVQHSTDPATGQTRTYPKIRFLKHTCHGQYVNQTLSEFSKHQPAKRKQVRWSQIAKALSRKLEPQRKTDSRTSFVLNRHIFVVKNPFAFGLRVVAPHRLHFIQVGCSAMKLYFASQQEAVDKGIDTRDRAFQAEDQVMFRVRILRASSNWLLPAGTCYQLVALQRAYFSLHVLLEPPNIKKFNYRDPFDRVPPTARPVWVEPPPTPHVLEGRGTYAMDCSENEREAETPSPVACARPVSPPPGQPPLTSTEGPSTDLARTELPAPDLPAADCPYSWLLYPAAGIGVPPPPQAEPLPEASHLLLPCRSLPTAAPPRYSPVTPVLDGWAPPPTLPAVANDLGTARCPGLRADDRFVAPLPAAQSLNEAFGTPMDTFPVLPGDWTPPGWQPPLGLFSSSSAVNSPLNGSQFFDPTPDLCRVASPEARRAGVPDLLRPSPEPRPVSPEPREQPDVSLDPPGTKRFEATGERVAWYHAVRWQTYSPPPKLQKELYPDGRPEGLSGMAALDLSMQRLVIDLASPPASPDPAGASAAQPLNSDSVRASLHGMDRGTSPTHPLNRNTVFVTPQIDAYEMPPAHPLNSETLLASSRGMMDRETSPTHPLNSDSVSTPPPIDGCGTHPTHPRNCGMTHESQTLESNCVALSPLF